MHRVGIFRISSVYPGLSRIELLDCCSTTRPAGTLMLSPVEGAATWLVELALAVLTAGIFSRELRTLYVLGPGLAWDVA